MVQLLINCILIKYYDFFEIEEFEFTSLIMEIHILIIKLNTLCYILEKFKC